MLALCILLSMSVATQGQMEGFIVGGSFASIYRFPHSAFLTISCLNQNGATVFWKCGSSVINQRILLTAAHCVADCRSKTRIVVHLGSEDNENGTIRSTSGSIVHAKYDDVSCANDIALVRMSRPVKLSSRINRVAIMKMPPYHERAKIAGWGLTNVETQSIDKKLKKLDQKVWKHEICQEMFQDMPRGTICASSDNPDDYVAPGDSGSSLIVRGYIQIGVVSYKVTQKSKNVIVYTDVGYYYDWIAYNARKLHCFIG